MADRDAVGHFSFVQQRNRIASGLCPNHLPEVVHQAMALCRKMTAICQFHTRINSNVADNFVSGNSL